MAVRSPLKKTICIENIHFWRAVRKMYLLQFHRYNKIYDFISFTKTRHGAQSFPFFEFKKNKRFKKICIFFYILSFHTFFFWKQVESENRKLCCVGNSIPHKMMFVSTIQVKYCGRRYISCSQKLTFQEKGKTLQREKGKTLLKFDFRMGTVLVIFTFF